MEYKYTLDPPLVYMEKEHSEITVDTSKIKGRTLENLASKMRADLIGSPPHLNAGYCTRLAFVAAGLPDKLVEELSAPTYYQIFNDMSSFLLSSSFQNVLES